MSTQYEPFTSWIQLLDHIKAEYPLFYHAPLDYRPVRISAVVRRDGKIRVYPPSNDCDPFVADIAHLDRFRRHVNRQTGN